MMSKPVAWMYVNDEGECEEISYGMPYVQDPDIQLLYTHPVKQLSDELKSLLDSVNGDYYLGKEQEEKLVAIIRKQYTNPVKQLSDEEIVKQINSLATGWFSDRFEKGIFITEENMVKLVRAIIKEITE